MSDLPLMRALTALLLPAFFLLPVNVHADAIVRSQAMFADTIAEIFVDEEGVRVGLEIGMSDVAAFRNILPDPIYEGLDYEPRPFTERFVEFFTQDLPVAADGELLRAELRRADVGGRTTYWCPEHQH